MVLLSCIGMEVAASFGMSPARIHLRLPISSWQSEKLALYMPCQLDCQKQVKYTELTATHYFIAGQLKPFGPEVRSILSELVQCIQEEAREALSGHHLLQWIAVLVERGNAAAMLGMSSVSGELSVPF